MDNSTEQTKKTSKLPKNSKELASLSVSKRMAAASDIGETVGKMMERVKIRANKFLKKYGYEVSITLSFHELKKDE